MFRRLVLALALLPPLLPLSACQVDEPGAPAVDDRPRGERCDDLQACGRTSCDEQISAVWACNDDDLGCGADDASWSAVQAALAECLEAACNTTTCDIIGAFTDRSNEADAYCTRPGDAGILEHARVAMFVGPTDDAVVECQALE